MRRLILLYLGLIGVMELFGQEKLALELLPQASARSDGVFLADVVKAGEQPLPRIQLAPAPAIGRPIFLSRYQVSEALAKKAPELICTNWSGPDRVRIARATRVLDEETLRQMLTEKLQQDIVKERGELELRFTRPWKPLVVPDDALSIRVLELPNSGVGSTFICRFEVLAGEEAAGVYQQPLQARLWREVAVAKSHLMRGQLLRDADIGTERRDILAQRDALAAVPIDDPYIELRENVPAGTALNARMFRLRSVVKRGRLVDALLQDDTMTISVRAEALEDGVPGQVVRLRNIRSKREFKGKVQDEQTVQVMF